MIESDAVVRLDPAAYLHAEVGGEVAAAGAIFTTCDDTAADPRGAYPVPSRQRTMRPFVSWAGDAEVAASCKGILHDITCGKLVADTTWEAGEAQLVGGTLTVPAGIRLTIEPGAIVKFLPQARITVESGGECVARGAIFTHVNDDTIGGDTLSDGDAERPRVGEYSLSGNVTDDAATEYRYSAPAEIGGTISHDTTLVGHRVYTVKSNLTVTDGTTLSVLPGAILKFNKSVSLTIESGATLSAVGTSAAPVVFTSINDDEWGGDTNGDGGATVARPGDWTKITVNGTADFYFTRVLYSSRNSTTGALNLNGGTVKFIRGTVAHCAYDAVGVEAGHFYMTNSVIADALTAFRHQANDPIVNCVIYDCGRLTQGGGQHFVNCVFSHITETWEAFGFPNNGTTYDHCVFWNENGSVLTGEGTQDAKTVCGRNGNLWGDPRFLDPENADFRVAPDSPCVDAANGTVAPADDYFGRPRMDVTGVKDAGIPNADGICPDIGIYEVDGLSSVLVPDLLVLSVTAPSTVRSGEEIEVVYTVTNRGEAVDGQLRDSFVFQAEDTALGEQCVSVGTVSKSYDLPAYGTQRLTVRLTVPALRSGIWRLAVTVNAGRDVYERVTANNTGKASARTIVSLPEVAAAKQTVALAAGDNVFEVAALPITGGTVILTLPGGVSAYGANGYVPGTDRSDAAAVDLGGGRVALVFPERSEGTTAYLAFAADEVGEVGIEVSETKLALYGAKPSRLANLGTVRLILSGTRLSGAEVALVGAKTFRATSVTPVDDVTAVATFALNGATVGRYDLRVSAADGTATLYGAVEFFKATTGPKLEARLVLPAAVRDGRVYTAWIEYANLGDEDMSAPIFTVCRRDSTTQLRLQSSDVFGTGNLNVIGIGSSYPAGVLPAGDSGRIPFQFVPSGQYELELSYAAEGTAKTAYPQFKDTSDYRRAVLDAVTRLNARGTTEYRLSECLALVLTERAGRDVAAVSGTVIDADTREPLAGVMVRAELVGDAAVTSECESDAAGHYSLPWLADGDWRLTADLATVDGTNIAVIVGQQDVNRHVLPLRRLASVSGVVLTADTHEPVVGTAVRLYADGGNLATEETVTDDYGAFRLDDVHPGNYALVVNSLGGYVGDVITNLVLAAGASHPAGVFELSKGAVLYGIVTLDGQPVTNGTVYAYFADGSAARAECSEMGTYCFDGLPAYDYRVQYKGIGARSEFVDVPLAATEVRQQNLEAKLIPLFFPIVSHGYGTLSTPFMVSDPVLVTNATAFAWDFENDGIVDSTEASPTHTYAAVGAYDVKLVVTTPQGLCTSVCERCVTVEEGIDNVLMDNAFRVDETPGIECTALGADTLTLVGTPPFPLAVGTVIGGSFGDDWYIRRITGIVRHDDVYSLTTEVAALTDLYESCCFVSCQKLEMVNDPQMPSLQLSEATTNQPPDEEDEEVAKSIKFIANVGASLTGRINQYIYSIREVTVKNGETYVCVGAAGELEMTSTAEFFGEVGFQGEYPVKLKARLPTPVPFVTVQPGVVVGARIAASAKAAGTTVMSARTRVKLAIEKYGDKRWQFVNPWDSFTFDCKPTELSVAGKIGVEFYATLDTKMKAFEVVNVGIGNTVSLMGELSGGVNNPTVFELSLGDTVMAEANLFDASDIPAVGKWVDFKLGISGNWGLLKVLLYGITSVVPDFDMTPAEDEETVSPAVARFADRTKIGEKVSFRISSLDKELCKSSTPLLPVAWHWSFPGSDDKQTSEKQKPDPVIYREDGVYKISLKVEGEMLSPWFPKTRVLRLGLNKPPEDEQKKVYRHSDTSRQSVDPNEMAGPTGVGGRRIVKPGEWLDYTIYFENQAVAAVPAQEVIIDARLSEYLDWSTFELGEIAFNAQNENGLAGLSGGELTVAQADADCQVRMSADFDAATGEVRWYLRSYDPNRSDYGYWPAEVDAGFLPPNDETHRGEGHVTYRVRVRDDAPADATIAAAATIVFDYNDPIATDPAWWNTVGNTGSSFDESALAVDEGEEILLTISGGDTDRAATVTVYLSYLTAAAADLGLANGRIDGETPKGGLKFPLTLAWKAGDVEPKKIAIPVKADKAVEDDETLVFQLAASQGMELGEMTVCKVTIRDANVAADYAAKQAKETVKTKKGVETNALAVACSAADGSGDVCGYTTGQGKYSKGSKASLKATARPGWEFKGWGEVSEGVTNVVSDKASWNVTLTNDAEIVALFGRIPYVVGLASPADGGKVTGSGYCAAGKKVSLKAAANKNFAFVGWYAGEMRNEEL